MSTASALKAPAPITHEFGARRVAAIVLLIIVLAAAAFVVGRLTASTQSSTAPAATHLSLQTNDCRPHLPC